MDLSTFEYLPVSHVIDLSAPSSPTSQIFDIDDEIAQHDSDDDSSSASDSDPVDQRVSPAVGDTEIVDFGTADQPRELRIGSDLSTDERDRPHPATQILLGPFFAWSYEDMPGLDPSIVQHRLPLLPQARPVKQKLRRLHPRWSLQVKEEIQKQLSVGFLSVVEYPEWLANVVPVPKKDGKILMAPEDMEKTSFITSGIRSLAALERFFERIRQFRLRLNPKKCTFGVTSGKLLGHMVSERGIESQPTVWDDQCQRAFERIREYLLSPPVLAPPTPGRPLLLYLSVSDVALGCMLAQLDDSGKDRAIYYLSKRMLDYETRYVMIERYCLALVWATRRLRHYMTEYSVHLISRLDPLRYLFDRPALSWSPYEMAAIDDDFPDEDVAAVTSLSGWRMYFDGAANHSGYGIGVLLISPHGDHIPRSVRLAFTDRHPATNNIVEYEACILGLETALELGIRQMEVFGDSNLVLRQIQGEWKTRDVKLRPYHAYLELLVARFEDLRYTHLPRAQKPSRSAPAYCCLIDDMEIDDGLPWYHDIYHFLRLGVYPEAATAKDKRALRTVGHSIRDLRRDTVQGDHLTGCYYCVWTAPLPIGQIAASLFRGVPSVRYTEISSTCPPSELHALTSPWPFSAWGIDIIGKISPKSSSGHEFILVAIDYSPSGWRPPHTRDRGVHFRAEAATPYSLVYGMEAMLPVEIEMGSLRVALEQQIPEADWAQARFDQLNLLDERRLRAADHVRILEGSSDPNWSGPYFIRELTPEGAAWLMDLDGNRFSEPTNVDQLKRSITTFLHVFIVSPSFLSLLVIHLVPFASYFSSYSDPSQPSFPSFLSPYHLGLRYVPCLKTTPEAMGSDVVFSSLYLDRSDSIVFGLPGSFMDPHGLARSSLTGCSSRRGHDRYLTESLRSTQPGPHFSTLGFHHASPSGSTFWTCVHDSVMDSDDHCYMFDDR
ncbi:hypothetical protein CK203_011533 [Vitis vinifera]|uniref:Retrovirus-related Pol polyprotein from transposon 17.6 n=1 Tax=Vitis vinifera TaxID=29760 RepID=A0A438JUM1_VITVI|nr:hypothetical protein CK203_011533 [Vitis vinifera]